MPAAALEKPASLVADVIYSAATDESVTMRYRAGADAEQLLTARKQMDEDEFIAMIKQQYGL